MSKSEGPGFLGIVGWGVLLREVAWLHGVGDRFIFYPHGWGFWREWLRMKRLRTGLAIAKPPREYGLADGAVLRASIQMPRSESADANMGGIGG